MVTKGEHTATFFRTDREEVQHTSTFEVEKPSMISWAYKKVDTKTAKEDAYTEAGAIHIEEITKEQFEELVS